MPATSSAYGRSGSSNAPEASTSRSSREVAPGQECPHASRAAAGVRFGTRTP